MFKNKCFLKYIIYLRSIDQRRMKKTEFQNRMPKKCWGLWMLLLWILLLFKYQAPLLLSLLPALCFRRHDSLLLSCLPLAKLLIMVSVPFSCLMIFFFPPLFSPFLNTGVALFHAIKSSGVLEAFSEQFHFLPKKWGVLSLTTHWNGESLRQED